VEAQKKRSRRDIVGIYSQHDDNKKEIQNNVLANKAKKNVSLIHYSTVYRLPKKVYKIAQKTL
jgi:hypothetical protein